MRKSLETSETRMRALENPLEEERRQRLRAEGELIELRGDLQESAAARAREVERSRELEAEVERLQGRLREQEVRHLPRGPDDRRQLTIRVVATDKFRCFDVWLRSRDVKVGRDAERSIVDLYFEIVDERRGRRQALVSELQQRLAECDEQLAGFEQRVGELERERRGADRRAEAAERQLEEVETDAEEVRPPSAPCPATGKQ